MTSFSIADRMERKGSGPPISRCHTKPITLCVTLPARVPRGILAVCGEGPLAHTSYTEGYSWRVPATSGLQHYTCFYVEGPMRRS
jgi:hypothetical protein